MSPKKRSSTKGFIIFHTPIQPGLFSSENYTTDSQIDVAVMRSPPRSNVTPNNSSKDLREGTNEAHQSARPTQLHRQHRLSCPSIRRLQAKVENENQHTRNALEQLLNTENGFIKELEKVLNQHDVAERRRRELLHKQWTERLWLPLQKQLHQRVSSCGAIDMKRRQSLYNHFLQHCNSKGYVFLDTYNLQEYNPFFRPLKKSHHQKLTEKKTTPKEAWMPNSTEADSTDSSRKEGKRPHHVHSSLVSSSFMTFSTQQQGIQTCYTSSESTKTESKAMRRTLSRFQKNPCHVEKKHRGCHTV